MADILYPLMLNQNIIDERILITSRNRTLKKLSFFYLMSCELRYIVCFFKKDFFSSYP